MGYAHATVRPDFTLSTDAGDIHLLGDVTGVEGFAEVASDAITAEIFGQRVRLISLPLLEKSKRAAGRANDLLDLAAIEEIKKLTPRT